MRGILTAIMVPWPSQGSALEPTPELMQKLHEHVGEVEAAIETALARGRTRIDDVAQILFVSKSTLQRRVEPHRFTALRRSVQLRLALDGLKLGREVGRVAKEVALSRDHLRVLVKEKTGLTPGRSYVKNTSERRQ